MSESNFWHPPAWKWVVALVLVACSALLIVRKPSAKSSKVLLPFMDSHPEWNGSYPYLIISTTGIATGSVKFESSILLLQATVRHEAPVNEFAVDLHSGMFVLRQTDLFISDTIPLSLTRTYRAWSPYSRAFGKGANHPYDICPTGTRFPYTYMDLNLEDDRTIHFRRISSGTGYADAVFGHDETSSEFYGAKIEWNGNGWTLDFRDGRQFLFPEAYNAKNFAQGAPIGMRDGNGNRVQLKRDQRRNLTQIISPSGRTIAFKYDGDDRITEARDDAGNVRKYSYDSTGHLETVADATHVLYRFEYAPLLHSPGFDPYLMTAIVDGDGKVLLQDFYEDRGQVSKQKLANGDIYTYEYRFVKDEVAETIVNTPWGKTKLLFQHGRFLSAE